MELEHYPLLRNEHLAWRTLCGELITVLGLDDEEVNEDRFEPLIRAIEHWGEELVPLRVVQGPEECARIARESESRAENTRTDGCRDYLARRAA